MKNKILFSSSQGSINFIARIKLIATVGSCFFNLCLTAFAYGQNANTEPPNYAAIAAGSIFFWDDQCSTTGFVNGSDVLRSTFLFATSSRIHEGFWEGFDTAKASQQTAKSSYFDIKKKEWVRMANEVDAQDCKKIRESVITILAPLVTSKINTEKIK